jgi:hypothetical protein
MDSDIAVDQNNLVKVRLQGHWSGALSDEFLCEKLCLCFESLLDKNSTCGF